MHVLCKEYYSLVIYCLSRIPSWHLSYVSIYQMNETNCCTYLSLKFLQQRSMLKLFLWTYLKKKYFRKIVNKKIFITEMWGHIQVHQYFWIVSLLFQIFCINQSCIRSGYKQEVFPPEFMKLWYNYHNILLYI